MNENKPIRAADYGLPIYFDLQARMGTPSILEVQMQLVNPLSAEIYEF